MLFTVVVIMKINIFLFALVYYTASSLIAQTTIISDNTWKGVGSSAQAGTGWNNQGYNDASWPLVEAPNAANVIPVVPGSLSMWSLPYADTAFLRKTFYVPVGDSYTGSISINADNEFLLYFNGSVLGSFNDWMGGPYTFNISPSLQGCVENVIAVRATNWGGPYGTSLNTTINVVNPLETPVAVLPTNITCTSFTANWNAVPTATDYLLDVSDDPLFTTFYSVYQNFSTGGLLSVNITGLNPGTAYYYRVRAVRNPLTSCYSNSEVFNPVYTVSAGSNSPLCEGDSLFLTATHNGANASLAWTGPSGFTSTTEDPVLSNSNPSMSGEYIFTMTSPGCDPISDTIVVLVHPVWETDTIFHFCEGSSIQISGNFYSSDTTLSQLYSSENACDSTVNYTLVSHPHFTDTIRHELCEEESILLPDGTITSDSGYYAFTYSGTFTCDSILVFEIIKRSEDDCSFIIPNVFSPNKDNKNDVFYIKGLKGDNNMLVIYNRWGQIVYENPNYKNEWNGSTNKGEDLPDGVYFYLLEGANDKKYQGFVHLMR